MTDLTPSDLETLRLLARQMMKQAEAEERRGDVGELAALLGKLEQIQRELEQKERTRHWRWRLREGEPSQ